MSTVCQCVCVCVCVCVMLSQLKFITDCIVVYFLPPHGFLINYNFYISAGIASTASSGRCEQSYTYITC